MTVTIFTPTYNRAHLIGNLYHSIQKQTNRDFEWIVIDDGSTDNTRQMINTWIKNGDNDFSIRYFYQENGGKHRATNKAALLAKGELVFVVDSDDTITDDAIEKIIGYYRQINNKSVFAGLFLAANNTNDEEPTQCFCDYSFFEKDRHPYTTGEKADVLITEVLRNYPYPEFDGEKFMTEGVIYNRMARDGLLIRWIDDTIYLYEYQKDGLTNNSRRNFLNNPRGYYIFLKEKNDFLLHSSKAKFLYMFYCDLKETYSIKEISEITEKPIFIYYVLSMIYRIKHGK